MMKTLGFFVFGSLVTIAVSTALGQWSALPAPFLETLDLHVVGENTIYAASGTDSKLFWSTDAGSTWAQYGTVKVSNYGNATVHVFGSRVLVGTYGGGIFWSDNGGTSWTASTGGSSYAFSFAEAHGVLFSSLGYRSRDGGKTWSKMSDTLITRWSPRQCRSESNTVYFWCDSGGVVFSADSGQTWAQVAPGAFQPTSISAMHVEGSIVVGTLDGRAFSCDAPGTWKEYSGVIGSNINGLVASNNAVYAGCWNGKVYRNSGGGWHDISSGIRLSRVYSMARNSRYLFLGTYVNGVYRRELSEVNPQALASEAVSGTGTVNFHSPSHPTWTAIEFLALSGSGTVEVMHFNSPPAAPQFSGTAPGHVSQYRWVIGQTGLGSFTAEVRLTVTPYLAGITDPSTITVYARPAEDGGQFLPLTTTYVEATHEFRATVTGFSEFVLGSDNNPLTSLTDRVSVPAADELSANWPNPFNPRTTIRYTLARSGDVRLKVHDLLGRVVAVLVEGKREAGDHEVTFDASDLSSGVYLCRLQVGDFARTRRLVLVK